MGSSAQVRHLRESRFFFFCDPENSESGSIRLQTKHKQSARPLPFGFDSFGSAVPSLASASLELLDLLDDLGCFGDVVFAASFGDVGSSSS
jgi:hypothetical protein